MAGRKIRPTILVYQEFESLGFSPADTDLPQVVVGPAYDIADYFSLTGKIDTDAGAEYAGSSLTANFPASKNPGTILEDEVNVYLDNVVIDLEITDTGNTEEGEKTFYAVSGSFIDSGVVPYDCVAKIEGNQINPAQLVINLDSESNGIAFTYLGSDNLHDVEFIQSASESLVLNGSTFEIYGDIAGGSFTAQDVVDLVESASQQLSAVVNGDSKVVGSAYTGDLLGYGLTPVVIDNLTVTEVTQSKLWFERIIGYTLDAATITIHRTMNDDLMDISDLTVDISEETVEFPTGLQIPVREGHIYGDEAFENNDKGAVLFKKPLKAGTSAPIYIEYRSLRTDLQQIDTIGDVTEIATKVGIDDPRNPLGVGLHVAKANTTTLVRFFGIPTNNAAGYQVAMDALSASRDVYCINVLSDNAAIGAAFKAHCVGMSEPEKARFRVCTIGTPLVTEDQIVDEATSGYTAFSTGGQRIWLKDDSAQFLTDGVLPGDSLIITAPTSIANTYTVNAVPNETTIAVSGSDAFPAITTNVTYEIKRLLTKDEQAERIALVGEAYGSKRVIVVWGDLIEREGVLMEGYYLGCAIGGMTASLPPHQGFTTLSIAGVTKVLHVNEYFNDTQLARIAGGGVWIFEQDPGAAPVTRQQLTTDQSAIEYGEFSVVKNLDHLSFFFAGELNDFLGDWNVIPENLGFIEARLINGLNFKKAQKLGKIGAPVTEGNVQSVGPFAGASDRIEAYVRVKVPKAINFIGLHVVSYN